VIPVSARMIRGVSSEQSYLASRSTSDVLTLNASDMFGSSSTRETEDFTAPCNLIFPMNVSAKGEFGVV
jgi:hypothetical protein